MDDIPWYVQVDNVSEEEKWALTVLHAGGHKATSILDERIRRVSLLIQMTWTEKERDKRFVGPTFSDAIIPIIDTNSEQSLDWVRMDE